MAVTSLGISVTHAHAAGQSRHVHGRGWNLASVQVLPADRPGTPGEWHSHLLLLGIEFPDERGPTDRPANSAIVLAAPTERAVGDVPLTDDSVPDGPESAFLGYDLTPEPVSALALLPNLPTSVVLPPFARRAVSGVLRS